ncbi:MAG: hypothetical protein RL329_1591 [Bacteroidota bacterium]
MTGMPKKNDKKNPIMKKEQFVLAFVVIFIQINLVAASRWLQSVPSTFVTLPALNTTPVPIHDTWDKLLQKHAKQGKMNYKNLQNDKIILENYIQSLANNVPAANATKSEKMAFWLNAYNALTVKLILDNYPLKSIKDLDKGNPWEVSRYLLGGKKYSLNEIENQILRPMGDARIHFGLNCAAKSCPPIHQRAFTAAHVETQLDQLTRAFINKTQQNQLTGNTIKISNIFNWYAADFGNVIAFLNKYATIPVYKTAKISYTNYDWGLNE